MNYEDGLTETDVAKLRIFINKKHEKQAIRNQDKKTFRVIILFNV